MCKPVKVLGTIKRLGTIIVRFCAIETLDIIDRLGTIVRLHTKGEPFLQEMTFSFKNQIVQK